VLLGARLEFYYVAASLVIESLYLVSSTKLGASGVIETQSRNDLADGGPFGKAFLLRLTIDGEGVALRTGLQHYLEGVQSMCGVVVWPRGITVLAILQSCRCFHYPLLCSLCHAALLSLHGVPGSCIAMLHALSLSMCSTIATLSIIHPLRSDFFVRDLPGNCKSILGIFPTNDRPEWFNT
jgi:hypothetical protein